MIVELDILCYELHVGFFLVHYIGFHPTSSKLTSFVSNYYLCEKLVCQIITYLICYLKLSSALDVVQRLFGLRFVPLVSMV